MKGLSQLLCLLSVSNIGLYLKIKIMIYNVKNILIGKKFKYILNITLNALCSRTF